MRLIAVDPGLNGCGVALFNERRLVQASYYESHSKGSVLERALFTAKRIETLGHAELAIEVPRVYTAAHQKGDQNDLIALSLVVGAIAGSFVEGVTMYHPRDWKGTVDADEFIERRIKPTLTPEERGFVVLPRGLLEHNVWDAVGIGLKHVGRLEPRRVFYREQ